MGSILCRRLPDGNILSGQIVEVEAYRENEPACHAYRGKTPRTAVMFGPPGISYVYFIYGNYNCLNVVTEEEGSACAILIRAVEGHDTNGPGKLCRAWSISRQHNGADLTDCQSELWIAQREPLKRTQIGVSTRIGVTSAHDLRWRYFIKGHPSVSGPKALNEQKKASAINA